MALSSKQLLAVAYRVYYSVPAVEKRLSAMMDPLTNRLLDKYNVQPKKKFCSLAECPVEYPRDATADHPNYVKLYRCGRCRMVQYCCLDHQKRDWQVNHRHFCAGIAKFLGDVDERHHAPHFVYKNETIRCEYLLHKKIMAHMEGLTRPPAWMMTILGAGPDQEEIVLPPGVSLVMFRSIDLAEKFVNSGYTDVSCLTLKYVCVKPDDVDNYFKNFSIPQLSDEQIVPVREELVQIYRDMTIEALMQATGAFEPQKSIHFIMYFYIVGTINPYTTYCVMKHKQQPKQE